MEVLDTRSNEDIQLNERSKTFILETAKWANFLSIIGFIFLGLSALIGLFGLVASLAVSGSSSLLFMVFYLGILALYFFPIFYLYKAARGLKNGIMTLNDNELTSGFENLKSHYKFLGIFTITFLSIYILLLIFGKTIMTGIIGNLMMMR